MRSVSRRSFTVEVKSNGRRRPAIIASWPDTPTVPTPRSKPDPVFDAPAAASEKPRILPNLMVPNAPEAEPRPAAEDLSPQRKRGRPRKVRPEPVADAVMAAAREPAPMPVAAPVPHEAPRALIPLSRKPKAGPSLDLARGERWKRRLGRWSR